MRVVHSLFFNENSIRFNIIKRFVRTLEKQPSLFNIFYMMERLSKIFVFDCRDCGDCALPEMFYLCPESQCPKHQRIGPCGGSRNGMCEVHDDRFCVWYDIYERAKMTGKLDDLRESFILPRNWELNETSSWANYYMGRDHSGRPL